jgi:hypothetical protein
MPSEETTERKKIVYTGYLAYTELTHPVSASLRDAKSLNGSLVQHQSLRLCWGWVSGDFTWPLLFRECVGEKGVTFFALDPSSLKAVAR